jgi:hypothetical protein
MDGAFFPQSDVEMPEKEMSQGAGQHVVMPSRILPDLIVIHAQFGFGFFEALFNGPAYTAEPDESAQSGAERGIAYVE